MSLKVQVDWEKDGTFGAIGIDSIASLVMPGHGAITAEYGRDQSTAMAPTVAGRGSVVVSNRDRRFSPRNTDSPLYGFIKPARPVLITRTVDVLDTAYSDTYSDSYTASYVPTEFVLFRGHTDQTPINPDPDSPTVNLSLVDNLADFRGSMISTQLYSGIRTGQAIHYVLDAVGWSATLRDIDDGATVVPWWWEDNTDALTALEKLVRSEGPPAMLTMGSDGSIIFRDRHHRLLREESLTSQQSWRSFANYGVGASVTMNKPFQYDEAWHNIINVGFANVEVRAPQGLQDVWTSDTTFTISVGQDQLITASSSDPFYDAQTPVAGTDWTAVNGTVVATLLQVSGASATIKLSAVGANAIIAGLRLRARPVSVVHSVQVSVRDEPSIADYGSRSFPGDLPWCNPGDAEAVLETAVALRAQPLPIIKIRFVIANDRSKFSLLGRNLSERVTVVEPETATDADFFIENIEHQLAGEHDHAILFGVEAAPVQVSPAIRLGVSGLLGAAYLTNPAQDAGQLIRLGDGTSGRRVGEGILAW
jgi:hypothetical protein